jgi:hypothetical protein
VRLLKRLLSLKKGKVLCTGIIKNELRAFQEFTRPLSYLRLKLLFKKRSLGCPACRGQSRK